MELQQKDELEKYVDMDRQEYYKKYYQKHKDDIRKKQAAYQQMLRDTPTYEPKLDLYNTKEELKQWEAENNMHCINWEVWDELIKKGKQELHEWELEQQELKRHTNNKKSILRFVYNLNGQLITQGDAKTLESLLKPYGKFSKETITTYANHAWIKDGFYFTNTYHKDIEKLIMTINLAKKRKKRHNGEKTI